MVAKSVFSDLLYHITERRALLRAGAGTLLAPSFARAADFSPVNPELRAVAANLPTLSTSTVDAPGWVARTRAMMAGFTVPPLPSPAFQRRTVPGLPGQPPVTLYIIGATGRAPARPAILHMHGGGFIAGSAAMSIRPMQDLSRALDCVTVTVEYRLAPETRFPGSLYDNYAALAWLHRSAAALGVDPSRIAVAGESAGGGHAAMLALFAHSKGEVPIRFQALTYPMLDDRTGSTRTPPPTEGQLLWTAAQNRIGWTALLGVPAGSATVPAGAVPARAPDLTGLPPAFIGVGSIDLFVAEDLDYAQRLAAAGVPVTLEVVPGAFHGFDMLAPDAGISRRFRASYLAALRDTLHG